MIKFESFGVNDTARYREYYQKCAQITSDLSPVWRIIGEAGGDVEVLRGYAEGLCWHCLNDVDKGQYWLAPVGDWASKEFSDKNKYQFILYFARFILPLHRQSL